jgi:ATP-dependent DNA helicase RecG
MMKIKRTQLISSPEGKTLEFKRELSSPRPVLKTLVAFANTAGGRLLIGIDDDRRVVGVEDPLDEEERLCNIIADSISPRLVPNVGMITIEGKTVLVVEVFLSGLRPHYLTSEGLEKGSYVRLGSSNRQTDRELLAELRRSAEGVSFDELPMVDLRIDDLDLEMAQTMFSEKRSLSEKELFTLKLTTREQGRIVPTKGAVLLLGKERELHFPDAWVQCGRFIGKDKADIFDHIELYDHLPLAVDNIMLFLKKHAMRGADFSEIRRKDVWSIPLVILREVIINALVHSDYSQRGAPIRVAFFDDRIEVENPGILLPGLTIEDMKQGVSKIRNPVIARVFRELDLIEQWGSGIPQIFAAAQRMKLPEPQIMEIGMRIRVVVPLAEALPALRPQHGTRSGAQSGAQPGAQSKELLEALVSGALSSAELTAVLGLKSKTGAFKRSIRELVERELIEYTIPDKPKSRLQKYRLTTKGRQFVQ